MLNGERLNLVRKYRGLTLDEVSERIRSISDLSATKGVVSRWENGKTIPRAETIELLAEILEVEKEFLLGLNTLECELKELRLKQKLTEKELAAKAGLSEPAIAMFEEGLDDPTPIELEKIGNAFNIPNFLQYLLDKNIKLSEHSSKKAELHLDEISNESVVVMFKGMELAPTEREQVLKMLEVLFPDYK